MTRYSTRQAAKKLGLGSSTLARYIEQGKLPAPQIVKLEGFQVHSWSDEDIEKARKLLPKIANGRKTRWQRQRAQQQISKGKTKGPKKKK